MNWMNSEFKISIKKDRKTVASVTAANGFLRIIGISVLNFKFNLMTLQFVVYIIYYQAEAT